MSAQGKRVLMVVAPKDFRDEEFVHTHAALQTAGAHITVASTRKGECTGMLGARVEANTSIADAEGDGWDAVVFVGGHGADVFWDDPVAHKIAQNMVREKHPLAAICIAPSTLARAGVLDGVEATAWKDREDDLKAHGAKWTGEPVTRGTSSTGSPIVTSNGPKAAFAFGQAVVQAMA